MECNKNCNEVRELAKLQEDFIHSMGDIMDKLDNSQLMVEGNAFDAINKTDTALNLVKEGIVCVDELMGRITCVNKEIDNAYNQMQHLHMLSGKFGEFSKSIGSISNRTGALSRATSIEAAKGMTGEVYFAQIAADMKNLSIETATCSNEIDETVQEVQMFASKAGETMVRLHDMAEMQNTMIEEMKSVLEKILDASFISNDVSRNMEHEIAYQRNITDSAMNAIVELKEAMLK